MSASEKWTTLERAYFHVGLGVGLLTGSGLVAVMWWLS